MIYYIALCVIIYNFLRDSEAFEKGGLINSSGSVIQPTTWGSDQVWTEFDMIAK